MRRFVNEPILAALCESGRIHKRLPPFFVLVLAAVVGVTACSSSPPKLSSSPRGAASPRASAAPGVMAAPCTAETADCDGDPANGCEAQNKPALLCGPCGCPVGAHCRQGVCARDVQLSSSATSGHTCAIAPNGLVACWGSRYQTSSAADATPRFWTGMKDAVLVRTDGWNACAVDSAGTAFCDFIGKAQALSANGAIPIKGAIDVVSQRALFDDNIIDMSAPYAHTYRGFERALAMVDNGSNVCVLLHDGQVSCFSSKLDSESRPAIFHKVGEVIHLAAGDRRMCVVSRPGNVACWDHWVDVDGHSALHDPVEKSGIEDAVEVAPGKRHTCALRKNGEVLCWGYGGSGELGDGTRRSSETPVTVADLKDALHLVSGDGHSCAMRRDGQVVCWGTRRAGGLGDGLVNVRVSPTEIESINDAVSVSGSLGRTCALRRSGKVACWGLGGLAAGPPGSPARGLPPVEVPKLTNIRSLTVGYSACATDEQGRVFCWPGAAPNVPGREPVRIEGLPPATKVLGPDLAFDRWPADIKNIGIESRHGAPIGVALLRSGEVALFRLEGGTLDGVRHARTSIISGLTDVADLNGDKPGGCVVRRDGSVACIEFPSDDRLDEPKRTRKIRPITGITGAIRMAGGCAATKTGTALCLHYNHRASRTEVQRWKEVNDVVDVRGGDNAFKCALVRSGKVFCSGSNNLGERGIGDTRSVEGGTFVKNLDDAVSLSISADQACAVRGGGHVVCWGSNELDETGGDAPFVLVPQEVAFPSD